MHKNCAFVLLLACTLTCAAAVAKDHKCTLKKLTSVELQVGQSVWLPVSLNGSRAWMRLDTGAAFTMIYGSAARAFGLSVRALPVGAPEVHYNTLRLDQLAVLDSLQIGTVRLGKGSEFLLIPESGDLHRYRGDPILGVLAMDVFAHVDFELDLAHRTLTLFSQEHCPGNAAYWSDIAASVPMYRDQLGELHFPMELDGKRIDASMATGHWDSSLRTDVTKHVFNFDEHSPGNEVQDVSGKQQVYYRAMKLTAPGLEVTNARIHLLAPVSACSVETTGLSVGYNACGLHPLELGISVLEKLHLYFATGKRMLYFTAADTSGQAASTAGPGESAHSDSRPGTGKMPAAAPK